MASQFTALYDANILYPSYLRDLMVELATTHTFRARWTTRIHDEWSRNLLSNNPYLEKEKIERTISLMNSAVDDCLVTDYEHLIEYYDLPDKDDRHVVAAAVKGNCDAIVTCNLKDFPPALMKQLNIEIKHPDDFIADLYELHSMDVVQAVIACVHRKKRPPITTDEYLAGLRKLGLTTTANIFKMVLL